MILVDSVPYEAQLSLTEHRFLGSYTVDVRVWNC